MAGGLKGKDVKGENTKHGAPNALSLFQKRCPINHRTLRYRPHTRNRINNLGTDTTFFTAVLAFSIPLCSNCSILIKPSNTTKYVSLLSLLLSRTTCFGPLSDHHQVFNLLEPEFYI